MPSPDSLFPEPPQGSEARQAFEDVLQHVEADRLDEAVTLLERLPFEALDGHDALVARALALQLSIQRTRYDDALVHGAAALDITDQEPLVYHLLGQALWATGDIRTAADAIVRAAELLDALEAAKAPMLLPVDAVPVYFMAGEVCQYYEEHEAALSFFRQAGRHAPEHEAVTHAIAEVQTLLDASRPAA